MRMNQWLWCMGAAGGKLEQSLKSSLPEPHGRQAGRTTRRVQAQRGFSLVEVSIVTAIVLLLAVIGIPAISGYLIENKVPKVGEDLVRFILQAQVGSFDGTGTPYASMNTNAAARYLHDSSVISIRESGGSQLILHGLGGSGEITVAPQGGGTAFSIVLDKVNHAACPSIASVLQRVSDRITLSADGQSSTVLKDESLSYSALTAQLRCSKGDSNTFTFVVS